MGRNTEGDQESKFTSKLLNRVYELLHVKTLRTTSYHLQTEGLVERFIPTLKEMLRKTACEKEKIGTVYYLMCCSHIEKFLRNLLDIHHLSSCMEEGKGKEYFM